ncbi:MAG: nucleotidyltransferase domain-containing protein [Candidatus Latescibacterota bacterium]|nr:MAG: nucleotidyltransferase domain-containing protein [Candidatus Latescibacterota bacterium]
MPVRSLTSPVLRWPDAQAVDQAVRRWARKIAAKRPEILRIGYFGSYARGNWGVGSDLDLVMVVDRAEQPFERRASQLDLTELPVPAEVLVYTVEEWERLSSQKGRFALMLNKETIWIYSRSTT